LFKLTAALRDAIIPHDDDSLLLKNMVTFVLVSGGSYVVGFLATNISQLF